MYLMTFHINGTERTCGAKILTGSAADATLIVDNRYFGRIRVIFVRWHHLYRSDRAMTGTVATFHTVGQWHAVFLYPYGMTYLYRRFVSSCDFDYGSGRTYFRASRTLRAAIASFV
jgi:hypothetical protein